MRILRIARKNLDHISLRDLIVAIAPLVLIVVAAFWIAYQFVKPAPPAALAMTTGTEGGAYRAYAERYREILARDGITLELRPSSGSIENLRRLADETSGVDVGFIQSGSGAAADAPGLVSLGSLYYEPLWVFYRGNVVLDRLSQLKGKRVAIGPEGSGIRKLALQLLSANDAEQQPTTLLDLGMAAAAKALQKREIDAAFIIAGPDSAVVQELLRADGVRLMSFSQAIAYTRLFPFLSSVVLPQGAIDLARNIPGRDTTLLAPTANLVAREDLHPALMSLLIQAATEVHGHAGLFQRTGEFPAPVAADFPLSEEAKRFYKSGPSFLQRYLPFWIAVLVQRMLVMLVPAIAVLIPLLRILPSLYAWRIRRRIYRWYGELKYLELELERNREPAQISEYLARLDTIEQRVSKLKVPLAFSNQLYTLRQHISFVRDLIRNSQTK
ncbi:MAG: TAXI family TRAP transporter solute-binding subunit [Betaproteobacteria bacterium]|nr:TAXI family TRAP transporter solute-binding subunit [Betaproteobacteria bacterium]